MGLQLGEQLGTNFEIFTFPNLTHLAELTTLQIRAENGYGCPSAELIQYNLDRCPETLEHVTLDDLGLWHIGGQPSAIQQMLGSTAASLTCLEMRHCEFSVGRSSISCLAHLKSLSFQGSTVWGDPSGITMLTNLTLLDLSESEWNCPTHFQRVPVVLLFTRWSALQLLKLSNCSLFERQSVLHLPGVVDLQLDWAPVSIGSSTLCICTHFVSHQWMSDLLPHARLLVELDISLDRLGWYSEYAESQMFAERLGRLLSLCPRVQSFTFTGISLAGFLKGEKLIIDRHSGACLHRLSLSRVSFQLLDLQNAFHLTSLELHDVNAAPDFTLVLPPRLQSFKYTGSYLFAPQARHMLLACTFLNKLTLEGKGVIALSQFDMPLLPNSLRHLDIQSARAERGWVDCCVFECLYKH